MKNLIFFCFLFSSCWESPTDPEAPDTKQLQALWNINTNSVDVPNASPIVIENSKIVFAGGKEITALDINTGNNVWSGEMPDEIGLQSVVILFDSINSRVVSNHKFSVRVWDAENGEVLFELNQENGILAHIAGNNSIIENGYGIVGDILDAYVINDDGSLRYTLDVEYGTSGIAYANNKVYLAQGKTIHGALTLGRIHAFNSQNGDSLWQYNTENGGFSWASLRVENSVLYGGTLGNSPNDEFIALNTEDGDLIWKYETSDPIEYTRSFTSNENNIFVVARAVMFALDKQTGEKKWRFDWTSSTLVKPVYLEGYVYHSDHNQLFVLDAETGKLVHSEPVPEGGSYFWHLAVSEDKLFAQTSNQLIAYQPWHLRD